jgi:NAD(P)-dependent dehydrogenase (short-subunit alcohol dehydrogenase family)
MMDLAIKGKVALITGASSGIGRQTVIRFAEEGVRVAPVARRKDLLEALAQQIRSAGGEVLPVAADITQPEEASRCVEETLNAFGKLDILVNAAGMLQPGSIENTTIDMWDKTMDLNLRAVFNLMNLSVPHLIETKGNIVNVSSVNGQRSFPGVLAYNVSKSGVDQLTRCAALELASTGVRVNAICPGVVRTNLHRTGGMDEAAYAKFLEHSKTTHPMGRVGMPEEAADLIAFLASERAGWITGVTTFIDGGRGQTCAR